MKEPYKKVRDRFFKEVEDFWSDPSAGRSQASGRAAVRRTGAMGALTRRAERSMMQLTKEQRQKQHRYRQDIRDEVETRWGAALFGARNGSRHAAFHGRVEKVV